MSSPKVAHDSSASFQLIRCSHLSLWRAFASTDARRDLIPVLNMLCVMLRAATVTWAMMLGGEEEMWSSDENKSFLKWTRPTVLTRNHKLQQNVPEPIGCPVHTHEYTNMSLELFLSANQEFRKKECSRQTNYLSNRKQIDILPIWFFQSATFHLTTPASTPHVPFIDMCKLILLISSSFFFY